MKLNYGLALFAAAVLVGCGDRSPDEYRKQKLSNDEAQIEANAGIYVGAIFSRKNHESLGTLEMDVQANTTATSGSDTSANLQATINGTLKLVNSSMSVVSFQNGQYDTADDHFNVDLTMKDKNGNSVLLVLSAAFDGNGNVSGTLIPDADSTAGGSFTLRKNATLPQGALSADPTTPAGQKMYEAKGAKLGTGVVADLEMVILEAEVDTQIDFYNALSPVKHVDVTVLQLHSEGQSGGPRANVFPSAIWDQRSSTIQGTNFTQGQGSSPNSATITLQCHQLANGWHCDAFSTAIAGAVFSADFTPAAQ